MAHVVRCVAVVLLALALSACHEADIAPPAGKAQAAVAAVAVPAVMAAKNAVESAYQAVAPRASLRAQGTTRTDVSGASRLLGGPDRPDAVREPERQKLAAKLIVRWEVTSETAYNQRYSGVLWPGGASGPTWAVGYDGGHQTRATISRDWADHARVADLVETSGVVGSEAQRRIMEWVDIKTPFDYANRVFTETTLPAYTAAARRALGPEFDDLDNGAHAALVSLGYNRGWSMTGPRRAHMRAIRDECVPALDSQCIARELNAMCDLWPQTPGLCNRRRDEARTALRH